MHVPVIIIQIIVSQDLVIHILAEQELEIWQMIIHMTCLHPQLRHKFKVTDRKIRLVSKEPKEP